MEHLTTLSRRQLMLGMGSVAVAAAIATPSVATVPEVIQTIKPVKPAWSQIIEPMFIDYELYGFEQLYIKSGLLGIDASFGHLRLTRTDLDYIIRKVPEIKVTPGHPEFPDCFELQMGNIIVPVKVVEAYPKDKRISESWIRMGVNAKFRLHRVHEFSNPYGRRYGPFAFETHST